MDWIQYYYAVNVILAIVIMGYKAFMKPNEIYNSLTNSQRFIGHILIGLPMMLPYAGRILGWW